MKRINAVRRRLTHKFYRRFYSLFYRFVHGRKMPLCKTLTKTVRSWEIQQGKGDIPITQDTWDNQYISKKWKYMEQIDELARYSIIIGYMAYLKPGGAVLDVGCGEGILFERYRPYGYSKYLGIDISEASLAKLIEKQDEKTLFVKADAESYIPNEQFDIIVFNETLYYFYDPLDTVENYLDALNNDGVFVVSTYTASERAMSILRRLKDTYPILDESGTFNETTSRSWICSVFNSTIFFIILMTNSFVDFEGLLQFFA